MNYCQMNGSMMNEKGVIYSAVKRILIKVHNEWNGEQIF